MIEYIKQFFRHGVFPSHPFTWIGMLSAAFSIALLIQYGFDYNFGRLFLLFLDGYDQLISILLGFFEPFAEMVLVWVNSIMDWDLELYPHWKHVVVLMLVYSSRLASNFFTSPVFSTGVFVAAWGLVIALASGVGAGTIPLAPGDITANFLMASIPIIGFFIFRIGFTIWAASFTRIINARNANVNPASWWLYFNTIAIRSMWSLVIALALVAVSLQVPLIRDLPGPGIVLLGCLVILLALESLGEGLRLVPVVSHSGRTWSQKYWYFGESKIGATMLGLFFWDGVLLAVNEGLSHWGL